MFGQNLTLFSFLMKGIHLIYLNYLLFTLSKSDVFPLTTSPGWRAWSGYTMSPSLVENYYIYYHISRFFLHVNPFKTLPWPGVFFP